MRVRGIVMFLTVWLLFGANAWAGDRTLLFASVNWEPYAGENMPQQGVAAAIIREACRRGGLEAEFRFLPWPRAQEEVRQGKYDALFNAYYSADRDRDFGLSRSYMSGPLALCVRSGSGVVWNGTAESLGRYTIGVVRGYVNTPLIDNASFLVRDEAVSDLFNLRKLLAGRVDAIVIDKYVAIHLLKTNPTIAADVGDIEFLEPLLRDRKLYVMFSRNRKGWKEHLALFDKGLEAMKRDGEWAEILACFGFLPE